MKILKETVTRDKLIDLNNREEEKLPIGSSITKAIFMGGKSCCGSAYTEKRI